MMSTANGATPTYLRIIAPEDGDGPRSLREQDLDRSALSCCTTEDELSSVNWDAGDEADLAPTSPTPTSPTIDHTHPDDDKVQDPSPAHDHTHRSVRVRRRRSNRTTAVVQRDSDDERIYECIDDITPTTCHDPGRLRLQPPRQLPLPRRRSKVTANRLRQQRLSTMKGLDGYEYLDLSPGAEGGSIPRWTELSPALPPPRKTSAPVKEGPVDHIPIQPTLSVPVRDYDVER